MLGRHKVSLTRDVVGIGLCAVVGLFALTKAPVSVAELVSDKPLSVNFRSIRVAEIVEMIVKAFGPKDANVIGLEQLGNRIANVQISNVPAYDALSRILACAGFTYSEGGESLTIVPLEAGEVSAACGSVNMEVVGD